MKVGPGHYATTPLINESGQYLKSQYKNCPGTVMMKPLKPKISHLESLIDYSIPGPGKYTRRDISFRLGSKFNKEIRDMSPEKQYGDVPGPGSYYLPGDFGVYISSNANEQDEKSKSNVGGKGIHKRSNISGSSKI